MKYIGAHVSISGGVENAPVNAHRLGATAFAMFTKNQRQWSAPPLSPESIAAFRANCEAFGYRPEQILPHDTYLINLGQPDPEKRKRSLAAFVDELARCRELGLVKLNFHPGSHLKEVTLEEELRLIAASVREAVDTVPGVTAVFENTAGQGTNVGFAFEQIAEMLELVDRPGRVGVCIDTCHSYAAGYDLKTPEGYERTFAEFERLIGFQYLQGMHLNDSKSVLGGRLDRHNSIGAGELGLEFFRRLMQDERFDGIPLILETPNEEIWAAEIAMLKEFAGAVPPAAAN
ncbi:deoxyribonuclease IV [uncultured Victivallis sp.]|uniref:deoxyribonuclease IV n=1 Tax=uncultured Victivallis sp. TaxID=354118 RepID=UPI0025E809C5|nr:deoxyribonuclease IV [uncultured Victivallis sp.]